MPTCAFNTCDAERGAIKTLVSPQVLQEMSNSVTHIAVSGLQGSLARDRACGTCGNNAYCSIVTECSQK